MTETLIAPMTVPDTAASREVAAMMDTLYASWTARDRDAANAFLSADARIVLWGTSANESIERPEDADLRSPLGHGDGEGVVDDEHADKQREEARDVHHHRVGRNHRLELLAAP